MDGLDAVGTAAEYVAAMRRLKDGSGRTLRALEAAAAARGDVLPRSTLADMLRRTTLPRPELVTAFVRACGAEDQLEEWTRAYERVASGERPAPGAPEPPPRHDAGKRALIAAAALSVVVVIGLLLWPTGETEPPAPGLEPLPAAGAWARIRPAGAPQLCVTEGRTRDGRYPSAVAVQRPCDEPGGPRTYLLPMPGDAVAIQWEHPTTKVLGCLTVLDDGPATNLLEPQEDCAATREDQMFRLTPTPSGAQIQHAASARCLAPADPAPTAEITLAPCPAAPAFLIDLLPPSPSGAEL
ncbi:hypothetical protein [Actinokineospora sp. NPDC004072]